MVTSRLVALFILFLSPLVVQVEANAERDEGMVLIPAGEFLMGSDDSEVSKMESLYAKHRLYGNYSFANEAPKRKVTLKAFYIDKREVTNAEYAKFIEATGKKPPKHWDSGKFDPSSADYPILNISQADSMAYAQWAGKRLPTAEEWEKAARGVDGRVFPWGNEFDPYKASTAESDMLLIEDAVCNPYRGNRSGGAPGDTSPYGVSGMAGNVREWTASMDPKRPFMAMVKGGSWADLSVSARAAYKEYIAKVAVSHIIGFRCAMDAD